MLEKLVEQSKLLAASNLGYEPIVYSTLPPSLNSPLQRLPMLSGEYLKVKDKFMYMYTMHKFPPDSLTYSSKITKQVIFAVTRSVFKVPVFKVSTLVSIFISLQFAWSFIILV